MAIIGRCIPRNRVDDEGLPRPQSYTCVFDSDITMTPLTATSSSPRTRMSIMGTTFQFAFPLRQRAWIRDAPLLTTGLFVDQSRDYNRRCAPFVAICQISSRFSLLTIAMIMRARFYLRKHDPLSSLWKYWVYKLISCLFVKLRIYL